MHKKHMNTYQRQLWCSRKQGGTAKKILEFMFIKEQNII